jgi:hypothetical protein
LLTKFRGRLTFANTVAVIALFFAVGGASFAADATNSAVRLITGTQVKNNSLTTKDIKNGSLLSKDFKEGQLPRGPKGDKGETGPKGDTGTVDTTKFFTKTESDARFLALGAKAADSERVDGLDSSALVQGNGQVLTNHLHLPNSPTTASDLFDIPGVGRLIAECSEQTAPERAKLRLIYHNLSGATQVWSYEYHDTVSVPNESLFSGTVAAGADQAAPYTAISQSSDSPFRLGLSAQPESGSGTHLTFQVSGVLNTTGYDCAPHGVAIVEP